MPPKAENISVLRIVIKENFSRDMAEILIDDIMHIFSILEKSENIENKKKHSQTGHQVC